jgi:HEPN superfamily RiboL-PSP-like protein
MSRRKPSHSNGALWQVQRLRRELDQLYARADPRDFDDPEIAADMGRYLCLRVSGFLEQATSIILREFCEKNSWGDVQDFALSWLDRMPNLSHGELVKLVGRFNKKAAQELDEFLLKEERKSRLNALIGIRNDVAHGKQQGMSRQQAWGYYEVVDLVIEWLLDKFAPQ